jgi:hypothetical protein
MSVQVKLYKYTGEPEVVDKQLNEQSATTLDCEFRDEQDVLTPTLTCTASSMPDVNYMYIARYNRYYWIREIKTYPNGKWMIYARVDVLKSYAAGIKALTGTVTRQESLANGYLPDERYKAKGYKAIVTKTFPSGMTADSIILMTVG